MRAKSTNKMRQFSSLLNEHWKRKQRLKGCQVKSVSTSMTIQVSELLMRQRRKANIIDNLRANPLHDSFKRRKKNSDLNLESKFTDADRQDKIPTQLLNRCALITFTQILLLQWLSFLTLSTNVRGQTIIQSDPRPTIYSGQVSFGLLLSAHSSFGSELSTSASHQVNSILALEDPNYGTTDAKNSTGWSLTTSLLSTATSNKSDSLEPQMTSDTMDVEERIDIEESTRIRMMPSLGRQKSVRIKRQIFESAGSQQRRQQQQTSGTNNRANLGPFDSGLCNQVNVNALYAGMGAIWASHQANLVGDSHLAIGTYVYDSCNDLDVGQRQSVRIVSNLNAFQQTTCESPRGSPISLTIAHGDNQLRAIQLLTSFRVPVITTKEHFALEDYNQLSRDQKRFLFTTAPSSRHLAVGALRFSRRIVSRSTSSPKLPNQFYKMSSKNGLIVISRNLPTRFISFLTEMIPRNVNYEILQSSQPIDQIRSVEALESILIKRPKQSSSVSSSESSRISKFETLPSILRNKWTVSLSDELDGSSLNDGAASADYDTMAESENSKMLSPTILMFITPSEAIDLVTRLRNDLAEVSKYYSLIVTTREDISPALKTIFHRGGSRLCSGKAFYTISPKSDDISEFSRYFRDTVQMEGEQSDHPLVCEFAKYQSTSKISADLDDISTEPVIKAVWSAAAAFKSVHRRECASTISNLSSSNLYRSAVAGGSGSLESGSTESTGDGRTMSSRQSAQNKSAHSECMVKMNKNMSKLVQRALKGLDVTINSTGLQALDGFRLKFDDLNELMTNKFSIKYINKECEITEIGQYTGFKDSLLRIDEETLVKSLESTMPDPWPVRITTSTRPAATYSSSTSLPENELPTTINGEANGPNDSATDATSTADTDENLANNNEDNLQHHKTNNINTLTERDVGKQGDQENEDNSNGDIIDKASGPNESNTGEAIKRTNKRSRTSEGHERISTRRSESIKKKKKQPLVEPVIAMSGRDILPGLTDTAMASNLANDKQLPALSETQSTEQQSAEPTIKPMRKLKPFPSSIGTTLRDWLPTGPMLELSTPTATMKTDIQTTFKTPGYLSISPTTSMQQSQQYHNKEKLNSGEFTMDLRTRGTTQAPVIYSTLPESGGNADLELPQNKDKIVMKSTVSRIKSMDSAATTESLDYVTLPSISKSFFNQPHVQNDLSLVQPIDSHGFESVGPKTLLMESVNQTHSPRMIDGSADIDTTRVNYFINSTPISQTSLTRSPQRGAENLSLAGVPDQHANSESRSGRSRLRSHLKWIYNSWFALSILVANICGALLTLYVLIFLLIKNCDGSLDRENRGIHSIHLLAIILVLFGSTLFIAYPTPALCLLRTSWHNFALVMLFGSLLLKAMQMRSLSSIGLGGRTNKFDQLLTLLFMVGVQVAFELQRWKYESTNYLNFVNQYFDSSENDGKKLMILSSAIDNQFNPLNSFNDRVTPVSIQVSEQYQNLLQNYCMQQVDDFLRSQIYLCIIVALLVIFSISTRKNRIPPGSSSKNTHHKLTSALTSGKLVASQHEANLNLTPSHFQFATNIRSNSFDTSNMLLVTLISAPIYSISIVLHIYDQNTANRDLISSVTMVLIAFAVLIGNFLPIILKIYRLNGLLSDRVAGTISRRVITQSKLQDNSPSSASTTFTMFPEFTPTGLRRPSSASGDSSSGGGSRRPFAETKESRRKMGAALANLGPSVDSLRSMGIYSSNRNIERPIDLALLNLKLNLNGSDELSPIVDALHGSGHQPSARKVSKGEKRFIMLDVDPSCPRHGTAAVRPRTGESLSKRCNSRASHSHQ